MTGLEPDASPPVYMTLLEVAKRFRCSKQTVLNYIRRGLLRGILLDGNMWRVDKASVDELERKSRSGGYANGEA